jgi:LysR family nitrogen assimilation transcriptional regulator
MLDLRSFKNFIKIIDCGSFSRAADRLHITQPALSQQVAALEIEFKAPLLHRTPKGVTPTAAGRVLYHHLKAVLQHVDNARDNIASSHGHLAGTVVIAMPTSVAEILTVPLFNAVQQRHPEVRLQIGAVPNRLIFDGIIRNTIDVAIMVGEMPGRGVQSRCIATETIYFVCGPTSPFAQSDGPIEFAEIEGRRLVMPCRPHMICSMLEAALKRSNIRVEVVCELDCLSQLVELAATGDYESVLPWSGIHREVVYGTVVARPFAQSMRRNVMLCMSDTVPLSDAATAVLQVIPDVVKTLENGLWRGLDIAQEPTVVELEAAGTPLHKRAL